MNSVGHKADLEGKREVLYEEGEYFAKYRKMKFLETSALTGENVNVNCYITKTIAKVETNFRKRLQ